jgi:DNA-binding transcriptional regulator YiaG
MTERTDMAKNKAVKCEHAKTTRRLLPKWKDDDAMGIRGVVLVDSVEQTECRSCGKVLSIFIPNLEGLAHAVALSRVLNPTRLNGKEIAFIRNAIDLTQKDVARIVGYTPVQVSRWENDKQPISEAAEKLLRMKAVQSLADKAPLLVPDAFDAMSEALDAKLRKSTRRPRLGLRSIQQRKAVNWAEAAADAA